MRRKLNILLIIETSGPGGAETVLLNIAKNLDRSQFNPTVVLLRPGWFWGHLLEHNIETKVIHSRRAWDVSFLIRLIKNCRQLKVDLIHSHLPGANLYSCLVGSVLRIPVIATFHNELFMPGRSERHKVLKFFLIRNLASKAVVVADYLKSDFINKAKFPIQKLITVYNGIEVAPYRLNFDISAKKRELGIEEDELIVGNVANLRPPKGHQYFIKAAEQICNNRNRVKFLIVGEGKGKLKAEIEEQIKKSNLKDKVILMGFREDVKELLHVMDVFVLSSISEGLPMAIVEAMAASKPVVATKVGGLPELIVPDFNGFLVSPGDPSALANKIMVLLNDKKLREQFGARSKEIVENKFSLEKMIGKYQNLYKELLS
jgi:glycosyltransferase involved in cell wall biosynthesis